MGTALAKIIEANTLESCEFCSQGANETQTGTNSYGRASHEKKAE